jgi:2-aminoethylphosphonate-pyruvate transaminase
MKTAVILAAGLGSRLKQSISNEKPKGFIEVFGDSLISRSINNLLSVGISRILIGTGYRSKYYEALEDKKLVQCVKNNSFSSTGSFYTLYNMRKYINEDFFILESDIIYEKNALEKLAKNSRHDVILASRTTGSGDEVFIEVDSNISLKNLSKNRSILSEIYGEFVGLSKLSLRTFKILCEWAHQNIKQAKSIHYEEAFTKICLERKIYVEKIDELIWAEIDTSKHYNHVIDYIYPMLLKKEDG